MGVLAWQQAHTKARWSNNAPSVEFGQKAIACRFWFSRLLDASCSILFLSVALASTFVFLLLAVYRLIIDLSGPVIVAAASALWHSRVLHLFLWMLPLLLSHSGAVLAQTPSVHQWPWIVPIRSFYSKSWPDLDCLTWCIGLYLCLVSHPQSMTT